jgi:hypothetical protein
MAQSLIHSASVTSGGAAAFVQQLQCPNLVEWQKT